jgi:hypothetical protein
MALSFSSFFALTLLTSPQPAPAATNKARIAVAPILNQENLILLAPFLMKDIAKLSGNRESPPGGRNTGEYRHSFY